MGFFNFNNKLLFFQHFFLFSKTAVVVKYIWQLDTELKKISISLSGFQLSKTRTYTSGKTAETFFYYVHYFE